MGQRGGFSRRRGGRGAAAQPLAALQRFHFATWLTQRSRGFSRDETVSLRSFSRPLKRGHPFAQRRACSPRAPREASSRHAGRPVSPPQATGGRSTRWPSWSVAARTGLWESPLASPEPPGGLHGEWLLFVGGQNTTFFRVTPAPAVPQDVPSWERQPGRRSPVGGSEFPAVFGECFGKCCSDVQRR